MFPINMYITLFMFQIEYQKCHYGANNYVVYINVTDRFVNGVHIFIGALNVKVYDFLMPITL